MTADQSRLAFSAKPTPRRRRGGKPRVVVLLVIRARQDQNLIGVQETRYTHMVFWSSGLLGCSLQTGDQQSRRPAVRA